MRAHPLYKLVVTGHSLGGGCSALCGLLLRYDYYRIPAVESLSNPCC